MTNVVGPRAVFGVIVPSTNTVVEHDYWRAGIEGVAFRAGSMHIADPTMTGDAGFEALLLQIRGSIETAVRDVLTAEPDRLVMGMSAETFWGGVEGNAAFERRLHERTGLPITTGASSCRAALETLGVRRIAVFSPCQPVADVQAIVQVGTNLSYVGLAERLESELGKPVVAINAATLWHALRQHGIDDRVAGAGVMLRDH